MTCLLDVNVLMALAWQDHEHHGLVHRWLRHVDRFATCPITQGGFLRISSNPALGYSTSMADAFASLKSIMADPRHCFWPDDLSFENMPAGWAADRTHNQVTDRYLVALALYHKGTLATLDRPLAKSFARESGLVSLVADRK